MTPRGVRWLAAVAVLAVATAIYVSLPERPAGTASTGQRLYPELEQSLNLIQGLRIHAAGDAVAVTIDRTDRGWRVAERGGYAADTARVHKLLLALAQARILEQKTSDPENHAVLGVEDLTRTGVAGKRIELVGGEVPVSLIVGKQPDSRSTYVRRGGEAESWQIDVAMDAAPDPRSWISRDLVDVKSDRVQSVEIRQAGRAPWSVTRPDAKTTDFQVTGIPRGRQLSSPSAASELASALSARQFDDVRAISGDLQPPASTTVFRTFDGLVVTMHGTVDGDHRRVRVESAATDAATPEVRSESDALAARTTGYEFDVPAYVYDSLFRSVDSLLK